MARRAWWGGCPRWYATSSHSTWTTMPCHDPGRVPAHHLFLHPPTTMLRDRPPAESWPSGCPFWAVRRRALATGLDAGYTAGAAGWPRADGVHSRFLATLSFYTGFRRWRTRRCSSPRTMPGIEALGIRYHLPASIRSRCWLLILLKIKTCWSLSPPGR